MIFGVLGAVLYLVLLLAVGLTCIRKGHWILFLLGILLPFLWVVGAVMPPASARA